MKSLRMSLTLLLLVSVSSAAAAQPNRRYGRPAPRPPGNVRASESVPLPPPASVSQVTEATGAGEGYIDVHMHLAASRRGGGGQRPSGASGGGSGSPDYTAAAANLVAMMDRVGVAKAIVLPPPQGLDQQGGYTYKDFLGAIRMYPTRLALAAGGGELNPMIVDIDSSVVTPALVARFRQKADEIIGDGAHAFGEMAILHFSFGSTHVFKHAPADHPLLFLLADIAAAHDMPVDLHWEAVLEVQATPEALVRRSPNNPASVEATVPALERLLDHNRNAKIVLVHVGWDNTGHQTVGLIRRLLTDHPNLYCGLKFVKKEYEPFQLGNKMADEDLTIRSEWIQLIGDFPDRFVVGADEFIGDGARSGGHGPPPSFDDTWSIIKQLPVHLRTKVGRENAARLYRL